MEVIDNELKRYDTMQADLENLKKSFDDLDTVAKDQSKSFDDLDTLMNEEKPKEVILLCNRFEQYFYCFLCFISIHCLFIFRWSLLEDESLN